MLKNCSLCIANKGFQDLLISSVSIAILSKSIQPWRYIPNTQLKSVISVMLFCFHFLSWFWFQSFHAVCATCHYLSVVSVTAYLSLINVYGHGEIHSQCQLLIDCHVHWLTLLTSAKFPFQLLNARTLKACWSLGSTVASVFTVSAILVPPELESGVSLLHVSAVGCLQSSPEAMLSARLVQLEPWG